MVTLRFSKARVEHFLNSVLKGEELVAAPEGWTDPELLVLAGVCLFLAISARPLANGESDGNVHPEHAEARRNSMMHELFATIDLCARLTMLVAQANYDQQFEPLIEAVVAQDGDGVDFRVLQGLKG